MFRPTNLIRPGELSLIGSLNALANVQLKIARRIPPE
jgi:hypothetical protein